MDGFLTAVAGVIALMVAVLTALKLLSENTEKMLTAYGRWRDKRNRPKYILTPTLDELARYSVKEPDRHYPSAMDVEEWRLSQALHAEKMGSKVRILSVMVLFAIMFAILGTRLLYLGAISSLSPSP